MGEDIVAGGMMVEFAHYPSLKGKVVIVTGGASGIGAAIVTAFAKQGAKIGFLDINDDAAKNLVQELADEWIDRDHVAYRLCDLRDVDALKMSLAQLTDQLGAADCLVNNAANDDRHNWRDVSLDYFDDRMNVNFRHFFFAIQALASHMIAKGGGSIVNVSSYSWVEGAPDLSIYIAANAAIHGLTRSFAKDLGPHRVRVNTIVPGWIMTERQKALWVTKERIETYLKRQCLPDPVEPDYVANMALFLASDDARMCSGGDFFVNGGVLST